MDDLAALYRRKLNLPDTVFTSIDHERAVSEGFAWVSRHKILEQYTIAKFISEGIRKNIN